MVKEDDIKKREQLSKELGLLDDSISNKLDKIFHLIGKHFNFTFNNWYIYGAEEGELGDLGSIIDNRYEGINMESIIWSGKIVNMELVITLNNVDLYLNSTIPKRWLFEDLKAIEKEIVDGKAEFERQEIERKKTLAAKKETAKEKQEKLIESIASKLTSEEKKFLKLKKNTTALVNKVK